MARIWTPPHTWKYGEVFGASVGNQELRDNLDFLKLKPRTYADNTGVANDTPTLTTSFAAVNDLNWTVTITTSEANEEVFLYFHCPVSLATGAQYHELDVLMDSTNYVSSGTPTPTTNGLLRLYSLTAGIIYHNAFRKRVVVAAAGTHTFKLRARVSGTGCVVTYNSLNDTAFFGVQVE